MRSRPRPEGARRRAQGIPDAAQSRTPRPPRPGFFGVQKGARGDPGPAGIHVHARALPALLPTQARRRLRTRAPEERLPLRTGILGGRPFDHPFLCRATLIVNRVKSIESRRSHLRSHADPAFKDGESHTFRALAHISTVAPPPHTHHQHHFFVGCAADSPLGARPQHSFACAADAPQPPRSAWFMLSPENA